MHYALLAILLDIHMSKVSLHNLAIYKVPIDKQFYDYRSDHFLSAKNAFPDNSQAVPSVSACNIEKLGSGLGMRRG